MIAIGVLSILASLLFLLFGFAGILGVGVDTVFQQQSAATTFLSGLIMFFGGFILIGLGNICSEIKKLKEEKK